MGKPKGTKDGQHLLVQVSATDSDAQQEFALPPRRMPRVRQKKSNGHRSNTCGHDFACFILVMILLIMMAAIGFLGFEYYKLSGQVEELTNAQKNWSPNGEMGIMVKEAAVKSDVDKQMEESMKNTIVLNTTIYAWYKQFLKLNLSVSRLIDDAKKWQAVLETTNQLGDLKGDVGSLKEKVTKLSSNGQEMDNDQRVMHNEIEQLKIDDEANKKVVTSLNSELPQFKDSLQTVVSRLGNLEHSHSEMKLETAGLALVNVTQMDADMQAMQSRMLRMSTVIKLLGATANSGGNGSANLTLVIQKLEDMKQAELEKAAVIESLKRRIGGVEQLEADHKDEHDMLITVITGFNSSLSDVKYDQQRTGALMEQHISNVTANIEAQLEKMTSSMGGLLEKTIVSPESFNVSSIINEVLNQVLLSAQVPMAEEIQLFSQEVEIIRNTLELQNMTIAELQQKLQQVQRSLWQLKAEVTAEKAANKHVVPTEDKPKLPTETRHNKTSSTTEMAYNQTTTEAAIDDVPGLVTEKVDETSRTSEPPPQGQTAPANPDIKETEMSDQPSTVTPLTTQRAISSVHGLLVNGTENDVMTTMTPPVQTTPSNAGTLVNGSVNDLENPETQNLWTNKPTEVIMNGSEPAEFTANKQLNDSDSLNTTENTEEPLNIITQSSLIPGVLESTENSEEPGEITVTPSLSPGLANKEPTELVDASDLLNVTDVNGSKPPDSTETPSVTPVATLNNGINNTDSGQQAEQELAELVNSVTEENSTLSSSENEAEETETLQTPTSEQAMQDTLQELFDQFSALDINENRHLSRKELSLILNTMDTDALDKFIAQVDTDDDHQIDKHELNQMLEYQDTTSPGVTAAPMMLSESVSGPDLFKTVTKKAYKSFKTLDTDADDKLSKEELLKVIPENFVLQYISLLDENGDSQIDEDELNEVMEQLEKGNILTNSGP